MSRLAVMMATNEPDGPMSPHFGKAEWILLKTAGTEALEFVKNEGMNGRSAADLLVREGCSDVILLEIGDGALGHLETANIRAWAAPGPVSGCEALRMFAEGELARVPAPQTSTNHGKGHGCCCGHGGDGRHGGCRP